MRQRRRVEAGGVRAGDRRRAGAAVPRTAACPTACSTSCTPRGPPTFEGLERALDEGLVDKVGFTGSTRGRPRIGELCGRHLQSPCLELGGKNPLVVMPDADLDLAVEGALFSGFGTAGQRCTSLGTVIVARRRSTTSSWSASRARYAEAPIGDPTQDVLYGPMIHERFPERFEDWLGLIRDHHARARLDAPRADHRRRAARGLRRRPRRRALLPPDDRRRRDRATTTSTRPRPSARSSASRASPTSTRRSSSPTATATGCPSAIYTNDPRAAFRFRERVSAGMVSINNSTSGAEAHLPVRRQRQLGQRLAPVGHLGARPVHPLAVDELGLRRASCRRRRWTPPTCQPTWSFGCPTR